MKYSVLIPAYNCAGTIRNTVESVRRSGLPDYEIVIVNDGSTDQTPVVLRQLCDQYSDISVITQKNFGVSAARNQALRVAAGDYVVFADADDLIAEDAYRLPAELVERERPDMLLFGMQFDYYRRGICYRSEQMLCQSEGLFSSEEWPASLVNSLFLSNYLSSACNKIIRTDLLRSHNVRFSEDMFLLEDCLFSLECLMASKTIYLLPEAIYRYAQADDTKKARDRLNRINSLNAFMLHFSHLPACCASLETEIYRMLLLQRIRAADTAAQLAAEAEEHKTSPFRDAVSSKIVLVRNLMDGKYHRILLGNSLHRLRHKAVVRWKALRFRFRRQ